MKGFLTSSKGNNFLGIILAIAIFALLVIAFDLSGAIGWGIAGGVAGGVGFGLASLIKSSLTKEETDGENKS